MSVQQEMIKAFMFSQFLEFKKDPYFYVYLERKEKFRGTLNAIFPVRPSISRIEKFYVWQQVNNAGMRNSGLLVYDSNSSYYWGRDLSSSFIPKHNIIEKLLDVDAIDEAQTVMEEVTVFDESESESKHYSST